MYSMGTCYESTASGTICPPTSNPKHLRLQSTKTNGWNPKNDDEDYTLEKLTAGTPQKRRFGSENVPFQNWVFLSSMLIC